MKPVTIKDNPFTAKPVSDPVFKVSAIVFEDGTMETVGGEHDIAFIDSENHPELREENLSGIEPDEDD